MNRQDYLAAIILLFFMLLAAGCAPVISKGLRDKVAEEISFKEVLDNPETYAGKLII